MTLKVRGEALTVLIFSCLSKGNVLCSRDGVNKAQRCIFLRIGVDHVFRGEWVICLLGSSGVFGS